MTLKERRSPARVEVPPPPAPTSRLGADHVLHVRVPQGASGVKASSCVYGNRGFPGPGKPADAKDWKLERSRRRASGPSVPATKLETGDALIPVCRSCGRIARRNRLRMPAYLQCPRRTTIGNGLFRATTIHLPGFRPPPRGFRSPYQQVSLPGPDGRSGTKEMRFDLILCPLRAVRSSKRRGSN